MNFDELNDIIKENAGVNICPICGVPFEPAHSRQKTCGTDECKRLYHNKCTRERRIRNFNENPDAFRAKHAEAQKRSRHKKKKLEAAKRNYEKVQNYWDERQSRHIETDGIEYGKKQAERTLARVPKIDVTGNWRKK